MRHLHLASLFFLLITASLFATEKNHIQFSASNDFDIQGRTPAQYSDNQHTGNLKLELLKGDDRYRFTLAFITQKYPELGPVERTDTVEFSYAKRVESFKWHMLQLENFVGAYLFYNDELNGEAIQNGLHRFTGESKEVFALYTTERFFSVGLFIENHATYHYSKQLYYKQTIAFSAGRAFEAELFFEGAAHYTYAPFIFELGFGGKRIKPVKGIIERVTGNKAPNYFKFGLTYHMTNAFSIKAKTIFLGDNYYGNNSSEWTQVSFQYNF